MLWRTHFLAGAAAGLLLAGHADPKTAAVSAGIAGMAALLPDLDNPGSKLGRAVPVIPRLVEIIAGRRGALHSLLGAGMVCLLAAFVLRFWYAHTLVYGYLVPLIAAGYLSHLIADSLTPSGVPWLWPWKTRFRLPLVQTGGLLERLALMPALLILCGWLTWPVVS